MLIPIEVDYRSPFPAANQPAWIEEYQANIHPEQWQADPKQLAGEFSDPFDAQDRWPSEENDGFEGDPGFSDPDRAPARPRRPSTVPTLPQA